MEAIVDRAAGIDVGQATVAVTIMVGRPEERPRKETRSFRTVTADLLVMSEWLRSQEVSVVAMEGTGIYWKPVHAVLEDGFEVIVGNAHHIKNVPGRKTDVRDSEWLAKLARHGLIRKSFVPPAPIRELRDLLRYRRKLIETRSSERNRLLKLLETANIKLSSVATDVFGVSGMLMLRALAEGVTDPLQLAALAKGTLRRKLNDLALALQGRVEEHHRFLLKLQLRRLDLIGADVTILDARIDDRLSTYASQYRLLTGIPGVDRVVAATLIAELGTDMSVFPSPSHAAAWTGVCPGNNESGGKSRPVTARKGNPHLRTALVEAAQAAARAKGTYFREKFFRLKARRGHKRAALAIAHKILIAAYHVLRTGEPFADLGEGYLDTLNKNRTKHQLVKRLERLGFDVEVKPKVA